MAVRRLPRRALLAATLGAVYALLILPAPQSALGISLPGVAWFALSAGLLFLHPLSYHAYTFWAILWVVYRGIDLGRDGRLVELALDLVLPVASAVLLMTSEYREWAAARSAGP